MDKPLEQLYLLIDQFSAEVDLPVKPGPKPRFGDTFYLKLYWFGILNRCPEKSRFLERAEKACPTLFKKNIPSVSSYDN